MGALQHIPVPLHQALMGKVKSDHPYIGSVFFTNMTHIDLPPGAEDFHWISAPTAFLCAVLIHWVGHKAGLRMSLAYRDGAGISKDEAGLIGERVGVVLERLAGGATGTFAEVGGTH